MDSGDVNMSARISYAFLMFGPYSLAVDYDLEKNTIIVTSKNDDTQEVFENEQLGELDGKVKFDANTVSMYINQGWGRFLPAFSDKIGFIYSVEDLDIRKSLLTDDEYYAIRGKYPMLQSHKGGILEVDGTYQIRIVEYSVSAELDIVTGKPIEGSVGKVVVDNSADSWYSKSSVQPSDLNEVAPELAATIINLDPASLHYFDPIEADIWRKYGTAQ